MGVLICFAKLSNFCPAVGAGGDVTVSSQNNFLYSLCTICSFCWFVKPVLWLFFIPSHLGEARWKKPKWVAIRHFQFQELKALLGPKRGTWPKAEHWGKIFFSFFFLIYLINNLSRVLSFKTVFNTRITGMDLFPFFSPFKSLVNLKQLQFTIKIKDEGKKLINRKLKGIKN